MADKNYGINKNVERRRNERFSTWLNTSFQVNSMEWQRGYVRDISAGGMQIVTLEPLQEGNRTTVVLENVQDRENVLVEGKVVWKIHDSPSGQDDWVAPSMGIEFETSLPVDTQCFVH
ncbi:MAG: PilZ domain-containing protein [Calditrichaeota bacterium]|nr:MAG: PilZ domain-containing protein [Calditrichota bacterium]